jgi:hypothetical protein
MTVEAAMTAFCAGKFELAGSSITLTQQASAAPTTYSGRGSINQTSTGRVEIELRTSLSPRDGLASMVGEKSGVGELVGDAEYFECQIVDDSGDVWETNPVQIRMSYSFPTQLAEISLAPSRLRRTLETTRADHSIGLKFLSQRDQPWRLLLGKYELNLIKSGLKVTISFALGMATSANGRI